MPLISVLDGGPAVVASLRYGAFSSPGSQWITPDETHPGFGDSYFFRPGDVALTCQLAESTTGTPPAGVIPSGWSQLGIASQTFTTGAGLGARTLFLAKILTAADIGATVTSMFGSNRYRLCAISLGMSRPVTNITMVSSAQTVSSAAVATRTATWDSVGTGSHLYLGMAHGENSISNAQYTWDTGPSGSDWDPGDATSGKGTASPTRVYETFFPFGTNPTASVTMDLNTDMGDWNMNYAFLLRFN